MLARLAREAPSLDLDIVAPGTNGIEALEHGVADAMAALIDEAPTGIHRCRLYDEELVTLVLFEEAARAERIMADRRTNHAQSR